MDLTSSQKKLEALDDVVEELPVAPSLGAFLKYLDTNNAAGRWSCLPYPSLDSKVQVDVKLHRSGRHPDDIFWSNNPKYVKMATVVGRQTSGDDAVLFKQTKSEQEALVKKQHERNARLKLLRGALRGEGMESLTQKLQTIFRAYAEFRAFRENRRFRRAPVKGAVPDEQNGIYELTTLGFQRLIRDCRLMDNSISVTDLDTIFTDVDAAAGKGPRKKKTGKRGVGDIPGDLKINFEEFQVALRRVAKLRYPEATSEEHGYKALLKVYIIPNAATDKMKADPELDDLLGRAAMNEIRTREKLLKRIYAHYATLELYSSTTKKITWKTVMDLNATLNADEYLMWLLNFEVVPYLMTKAQAMAVFTEVEEANDADEEVGELLYPAFTEVIGKLAVVAFDNAVHTLLNPKTDIATLVAVKKLVEGVPRDLWMNGTLGRLFRQRGYFTGPGGTSLPATGAGPGGVGEGGRRTSARSAADTTRGASSRTARSSHPGMVHGRLGAHMTKEERARAERIMVGKLEARTRTYQRQLENEAMDVRHHALYNAGNDGGNESGGRGLSPEGTLPRLMSGRMRSARRDSSLPEETAWYHAYTNLPDLPGTTTHFEQGVRAKDPANRMTSGRSFVSNASRGRAEKAPPMSKKEAMLANQKLSNRQKGVKLASFFPPVERAGHKAAVGGLVRPKDESDKVVAARDLRGLAAAFGGGGARNGGSLQTMLPGIIEGARKTRIASGRKTNFLATVAKKGHPENDPADEVKELGWFMELRDKALAQQGTGSMLTRWRGQLGVRADKELVEKARANNARL